MSSRGPALAALLLLTTALVAILALTTPWQPLSSARPDLAVAADPARDFTAAEIAAEDSYHRAVRPPAYAGLAAGLLVALLLGLTPLGARLVGAAAAPLGGGWVWRVLFGGLAVALVTRLVSLPFDMRAESVLRRYGLSNQRWPDWATTRRLPSRPSRASPAPRPTW